MAVPATRSQTLDRGLAILEIVASAGAPLAISQVAAQSGLHRSIVYRLLRTLEDHRLVARDEHDRFGPGLGLVRLAGQVSRDFTSLATPALRELADATELAAFVVIREGDEAVTMLVVEPSTPGATFTHRIGYRHPIDQGAPGHALKSFEGPAPDDPSPVAIARDRGWAASHGEVLDGVHSVAAPLPGYRVPACVAVSYIEDRDAESIARAVTTTRDRIAELLGCPATDG